jgi:hypothetical protein
VRQARKPWRTLWTIDKDENMSSETTVDLNAILHDGRRIPENLLVEVLGENRFRLVRSPGLVSGIAAGDQFELAPDEPFGYRLIKRGGNVCLQLFVETDKVEDVRGTLTALFERMGGRLDGDVAFKTLANLVFTLPVDAGFPAIEAVMARAQRISPSCQWFYGNVYDSTDGVTPLNWWCPEKAGDRKEGTGME